MPRLFAAFCCLLLTHGFLSAATVVVYVNEQGSLFGFSRPEVKDPVSALAALATPPSAAEAGQRLISGVLSGTKVLALQMEESTTVVDFSQEIIGGELDESRLATIFDQVTATLSQFGLTGSVRVQAAGRLLSDYLPPTQPVEPGPSPQIEATPRAAAALSGKKIGLSPGHGRFWNGSGWATQRPVYCSPLNQEDYHNLEIMQYLNTYLTQDGATTKNYRCLDKSFGTYSVSGSPWWQMAACYWIKQLGYPCSVYASSTGDCTFGAGGTEVNDDIRARPLASDYDNTDIYVSLHSNGYTGNCTGSCPTGTETYYDASSEHATWGAISQTLATRVNSAIMSAVTAHADSSWTCHGTCVKNSNGAYGEIRIPNRAAILTELGFHDTCDRDADGDHLRDNFFRSTAMWGMYKGICDYFGVAPTWAYYSYEVVTNTLPSVMAAGSSTTAQITLRNRGVLWNDARQFRLGAVGDSDPFSPTTRYNVGSEVGPSQTKTFTLTLTAPATPGTYTSDWRMVREAVTWFGSTVSKSIVVTDAQPPTVPTNLTANAVAHNQVNLNWWRSSDNVGVSNYFVYRDAALIASSVATNYSDTSVSGNTTYVYQVAARDAAGNESAKSAAIQTTTPPVPAPVLLHSFTNGALTLIWTDGVLQQASALTGSPGDWSDVIGAASPYLPPMDAGAKYFRLRH